MGTISERMSRRATVFVGETCSEAEPLACGAPEDEVPKLSSFALPPIAVGVEGVVFFLASHTPNTMAAMIT